MPHIMLNPLYVYTCPSDRWERGRGGERERERDGKRENGSEEEAEDTEKGCTCLIKIDRQIIKRTGFKNKSQSYRGTSINVILSTLQDNKILIRCILIT